MPNRHHQRSRPKIRRRRVLAVAAVLLIIAAAAGVLWARSGNSPTKTASSGQASIKVETVPTGAAISLDGMAQKSKSDTTVKTAAGMHKVKLQLKCYDTQEIMVQTQSGKTATLKHTFVIGGKTVVSKPDQDCKVRTDYQASQLKTYHSDTFGYSIAYPSDWSVKTDSSGIAHFYNKASTEAANSGGEAEESLAILALDNPQQLGPEAWYKARPEYSQEDQSQIKQQTQTINGQPAYRYETPYGFVPYLNTVFTKGSKAFIVQQAAKSPDRTAYDQIVQTFKLPQ